MDVKVGSGVGRFDVAAHRLAGEFGASGVGAENEGGGADGGGKEGGGEAPGLEDSGGVGGDLDPGADLSGG